MGDCADMDDSRIFCVYECMNWCATAKSLGYHRVASLRLVLLTFAIGDEILFVTTHVYG